MKVLENFIIDWLRTGFALALHPLGAILTLASYWLHTSLGPSLHLLCTGFALPLHWLFTCFALASHWLRSGFALASH